MGISEGGRNAILPGYAPAEEFSRLVRELAHELPHNAEGRTPNTNTMRETEAKQLRLVVGQTIDLDSRRAAKTTSTAITAAPAC